MTVSCPSYSNHIGSLRLSLFRWTDSYEKTLASEPLLRQTFKDFPDNSPLTLSISPETPFSPGEYLFVLDQAVERVGVWTQSNHPGQAQCFFNGKPIPRGFRFTWSGFRESPFPFRGTQEAYELASAPCPYPPEMQDDADDADDPIVKFDVQPDCFAATDDLGRTLPDQTSAGPVRAGKQVGIFYSTWHQKDHGGRTRVYDNTQILRENPGIENRPEDPAWGEYYQHHYWGKPLFGYYKTTDKWVMRKHAQMLANAQIDMVAFDCTNGSHTWMDSTWHFWKRGRTRAKMESTRRKSCSCFRFGIGSTMPFPSVSFTAIYTGTENIGNFGFTGRESPDPCDLRCRGREDRLDVRSGKRGMESHLTFFYFPSWTAEVRKRSFASG